MERKSRIAGKNTPTARALGSALIALTTLVGCASQEVAIQDRMAAERKLRCELRLTAGAPFARANESCDEFRPETYAEQLAARKRARKVAVTR